ncbi:isochorismatase family protein [Kocuria marina]|uniref:isochorismatase family protein n=1 Tax=Kocuria marina TaxID=223184 RepID=UPI003460E8D3
MATFTAQIRPYDLDAFSSVDSGLGWSLDARRCAVLVHDVLPYYLKVLDPAQQEALVGTIDALVADAVVADVPVLASAPRPASDLQQRGVGGRLWGLGPSAAEVSTSPLASLPGDAVWVRKRSLSAFYATDLDVELRRRGRDQLLIVGVFASGGVVATTFDALARDIEVFVVGDAVADYDQDLHRLALNQVARSTGQVIPRSAVTAALHAQPTSKEHV